MQAVFIEVAQGPEGPNWGKFCVAKFTEQEWATPSALPGVTETSLLKGRGWSPDHVWVLDLQTGEGAFFRPGGLAIADLNKHKIWVCVLYEAFLTWLYTQDLTDIETLPRYVELPNVEFAMAGYRRGGPDPR